MKSQTKTRWFTWGGWFTDKLEVWLENQAARGWHLVKADRLLLRFHFEKGTPKKVRYCVDYPCEVNNDYDTIFKDAGWSLAASGLGYYIWQAEYRDQRRPELFNDVQPLIERNNRLLVVFGGALVAQIGLVATDAKKILFGSSVGRLFIIPYIVLIVIIALSAIATFKQNQRLTARKP